MVLTTTNSIEGHQIKDYLGIVTGVSTNQKTSFSFKTEKNKQLYREFINEAKEEAFQDLTDNASKLKANAIVGIKLDIEMSSTSYFFVSVTGTAVKVSV
ncbi:YbjQ family protein [Hyunsoonleella rubra]|uniref:YbjQ family protein n=1 Tax=Hyunsoonleella rubra TaxID=1737062 RepID=A0ABW5T684_9FLAO